MGSIIQMLVSKISQFLTTFVTPLFKQVLLMIKEPILRLFYEVFVQFLRLMDALQDVVGSFSGARAIEYNGKEVHLLELIFFRSGLSVILWGVTLCALVLSGYFAVASLGKSTSGRVPAGKALGAAGKAMVTFALLPVLMIISLWGTTMVLESTNEMISAAAGRQEPVKISGMVFTATSMGAEDDRYFTADIRTKYTTGELDYGNTEQVFTYFHAGNMNFLAGILLALYFIFIYAITCLLFVGRCIQLLLLYLTAPYYAASIAADDGAKFQGWRDAFVSKLASGFGLAVSLQLFGLLIVPLFASSDVLFSGSETADFAIRMIFLAGSAYAITRCYTVLIQAISPQMAYHESMYSDALTGTVKMAAATAATVASGGAAGGAIAGGTAGSSSMMAQQMMMQAAQSIKNTADGG